MNRIQFVALVAMVWISLSSAHAVEPGGIIINEVYFNPRGNGKEQVEAIELLVITDQSDLNGLQISDRDVWRVATEEQCTIQDLGQGFLKAVPSGTLVVIYNGSGNDDIDSSDHLLVFWAKSSLFCNVAPTGKMMQLGNYGDNVHLMQGKKHLDFVQFRVSDDERKKGADPGDLEWHNGKNGYIDVGAYSQNAGFRFLGDKPDLNGYPAAWQVYSETSTAESTLEKPNGGKNTIWIKNLRKPQGKKRTKEGSKDNAAPDPSSQP